MTYAELQNAVKMLGLSGHMSAKDIRDGYRELVKLHHPDRGADADNETIRQLNSAYGIIEEYLQAYQYNFSKEQFYQQYPEERLREQFYNTDLWGGKG